MSELIDRQEAIDRFNVIRPVDPKKDEYTKGIDVGIAMCIVAVKDQPTIQVATSTNVGDTISRRATIDAVNNAFDRETLLTGFVRSIGDMPSVQPEPQWIPVEKELPEPRIDVWVNSDLGQMVGYYDEMVNTWYGRDYLELIVNAWMPLPEAYKPNK